jgi:hypothetical protein
MQKTKLEGQEDSLNVTEAGIQPTFNPKRSVKFADADFPGRFSAQIWTFLNGGKA